MCTQAEEARALPEEQAFALLSKEVRLRCCYVCNSELTERHRAGVTAEWRRLLLARADAGDADAAYFCSQSFSQQISGFPQDDLLAWRYICVAAESGAHAYAVMMKGRWLASDYVPGGKRVADAILHFRRAADAGVAQACMELGKLASDGLTAIRYHARGEALGEPQCAIFSRLIRQGAPSDALTAFAIIARRRGLPKHVIGSVAAFLITNV